MLQNLREYLANTPREQIDRDWAEVKAKNLKGPTVRDVVASFSFSPAYQDTDTKAFQSESAQKHFNFDLQHNGDNYAMAA